MIEDEKNFFNEIFPKSYLFNVCHFVFLFKFISCLILQVINICCLLETFPTIVGFGIIDTNVPKIYFVTPLIFFTYSVIDRIIQVKNRECNSILNYGVDEYSSFTPLFLTLPKCNIIVISIIYLPILYRELPLLITCIVFIICLVIVHIFNIYTRHTFDKERSLCNIFDFDSKLLHIMRNNLQKYIKMI